ncbi:MAG: hypothetical protein RJA07_1212 [Bacteroidota bacterium]|jgi:hypothetical protein
MNYQKINNILGWCVGIAATIVYALTMEPTVSFWDCGEFIPGSLKMEVVHPPGAPLFLFIAHMFTLLAGGNLQKVALMVNFSSALSTGMAMMFLFWTITALAKKMVAKNENGEIEGGGLWAIMGSGVVGAMAACFADSIWFSAVEGEVYAMSLFFTSIVFWAILKWENHAHERNADKWIVLIAFLMGLSTGVHLLNLLTIPAIAFVYYFKRYERSAIGLLVTFIIGAGLLAFVQFGIIQKIPALAAWFDRLFVNGFGMGFHSGASFFFLLIALAAAVGLWYTHKNNHTIANTFILSVVFIIIGYSAVLMVPVRSAANPPIDMNNPEDAYSLLSYLNREQYGDSPLFKGPDFTAHPYKTDDNGIKWGRNEAKHRYDTIGVKREYVYQDEDLMLFPRIWDGNDQNHVRFYKSWLNLGDQDKPTMSDNMKFFFTYQVNFMYIRYLMWNFSGRQNDIQGHGNNRDGNWITGIPAIDHTILDVDSSTMGGVYENNKGTNKFYLIPLLLIFIGFFYHLKNNQNDWFVVMLLFFFTGLAIVLYLNQTPLQPRERDYSYAGSVYALCIWLGLAVMAVYDFVNKKGVKGAAGAGLATVLCFSAPFLMAKDGWNDHDRSTRYTALEFAKNYLESCPKNAILFTQGDNDTYPLWYAQEVEGIRDDVRIINLSLLGVDWYVDALSHKNNHADIVPISVTPDKYRGQNRDYLQYYDAKKFDQSSAYNLADVMKFVFSDDPNAQLPLQSGETMNYWPVQNVSTPVSEANCRAQGIIPADSVKFPATIAWKVKTSGMLLKNDLFTLDIIAQNNWKRPICFTVSSSPDAFQGLDEYMEITGMIVRLTPFKNKQHTMYPMTGAVNTNLMKDNVMNKYLYGGIQNKNVYLDETAMRMAVNLQSNMGRLAEQLVIEGRKQEAIEVLDKCVKMLPSVEVPYTVYVLPFVDTYYKAGASDKAHAIADELLKSSRKEVAIYFNMEPDKIKGLYNRDVQECLYAMQTIQRFAAENRDTTYSKKLDAEFRPLEMRYSQLMGGQ